MTFFKRIVGYIIDKIIYLVPATIISIYMFYWVFGDILNVVYQIGSGESTDTFGWGFIIIILYVLSPVYGSFNYYINDPFNDFQLRGLLCLLSVMIAYIILEFLLSLICKVDLGSRICQLKLISLKDKPLEWWRILYRTILKYFSITFFCPILLFPLFNKQRLFLHEMVSRVKKVDRWGV